MIIQGWRRYRRQLAQLIGQFTAGGYDISPGVYRRLKQLAREESPLITEPRPVVCPKYPNVSVSLTGVDGNARFLLDKVQRAMRIQGVPAEKIAEFLAEAANGDYDHLLATCMDWVDVL